jgi:hypothetical protein
VTNPNRKELKIKQMRKAAMKRIMEKKIKKKINNNRTRMNMASLS